jgi:hypothetical protein
MSECEDLREAMSATGQGVIGERGNVLHIRPRNEPKLAAHNAE